MMSTRPLERIVSVGLSNAVGIVWYPRALATPLGNSKWLIVVCCGYLMGIAGCRVGPDIFSPPLPAIPATYEGAPPAVLTEENDLGHWWTLFGDSQLSDLLLTAQQNNLDVRAASLRVVEGRLNVAIVRGDLLPTADAVGDYSYSKQSRNKSPSLAVFKSPFNLFRTGFDASWELDVFGKLSRCVEASRAELRSLNESYRDIRLLLLSDVAANYIDIRVLQAQISITRASLARQRKTLAVAQQRQKAGLVPKLDIVQAESLWHFTSSQIPIREAELESAYYRLCILLGQSTSAGLRTWLAEGPIPVPRYMTSIGVPLELLRRRPDIAKAEQEVAAATANIGVAEAELYPSFHLLGTIGLEARSMSSLFGANSLAFSVGPSVRWNILQFGRIKNNIEARRIVMQQAVVRYQQTVLKAVAEVENALAQYRWQVNRERILGAAVESATVAAKLSASRYQQSMISFQRVIDTERDLLRYQLELASCRGNISRQLVHLFKAIGGGWDVCDIPSQSCTPPGSPNDANREI